VFAAIVGVGGLGCPAALALAEAGVALRLIDEDTVERSNLHRQVLFTEADVGRRKVDAARDALLALAPTLAVETRPEHLVPGRAEALLRGAAVIVEGSDNLPTKFLTADVAHALGVAVVHGACVAWRGTVLPVRWGDGACYRCVFEEAPDDEAANCAVAGVYGPVTSVVGAIMAADALRLLRGDAGVGGHLARFDGWNQTFRASRFARRADCPLCGVA
jgi:molybdopterin/thiamine biosynthesis adenylyltransferase